MARNLCLIAHLDLIYISVRMSMTVAIIFLTHIQNQASHQVQRKNDIDLGALTRTKYGNLKNLKTFLNLKQAR